MVFKHYISNYLEGADIRVNGGRPFDIYVHDERLFTKMALNPSIGAGEAYVEGLWDCERLDELFFRLCRSNLDHDLRRTWAARLQVFVNKMVNMQSRLRSLKVAERHYNLGNDLYISMLGPSMAYTCGYWKEAKNLDEAQVAKFDLICRKINLKQGESLLDLGCGFGTFAKYAAQKYGCRVVAVNISEEQVKYAKDSKGDLPIDYFLADYRDEQTYNPSGRKFDKVVSIGLCEHVGHKNYREFIEIARRNLSDEGLFLLHTIGKNDSENYVDPWINKYVFPNGVLPSVALLGRAIESLFILEDLHNFGADYDKTLMAWHKNFNENQEKLKGKYDKQFKRLWNYYLLSCAGAFRARSLQLWQLVLSPSGVLGGYQIIR